LWFLPGWNCLAPPVQLGNRCNVRLPQFSCSGFRRTTSASSSKYSALLHTTEEALCPQRNMHCCLGNPRVCISHFRRDVKNAPGHQKHEPQLNMMRENADRLCNSDHGNQPLWMVLTNVYRSALRVNSFFVHFAVYLTAGAAPAGCLINHFTINRIERRSEALAGLAPRRAHRNAA